MEEELLDYLYSLAKSKGITIERIEGGANDPDIAIFEDMIINMNPNYHSNFPETFRLAHELAHLIYSEPTFLYAFSPYFQNREERLAHSYAIKILANYLYEDVPVEQRNWTGFMDRFNLPAWFEFEVHEALYG